jgi:hypothetical protein
VPLGEAPGKHVELVRLVHESPTEVLALGPRDTRFGGVGRRGAMKQATGPDPRARFNLII